MGKEVMSLIFLLFIPSVVIGFSACGGTVGRMVSVTPTQVEETTVSQEDEDRGSDSAQSVGLRRGDLAPDFIFEETLNFEGVVAAKLSDLRGKVVLINFWASWCPYCDKEMPSLQFLYNQFRDEGFLVLGVNSGEDEGTARGYLEDKGLTFLVVLDTSKVISEQYHIRSIPSSIIVDKNGVIVTVVIGYLDWNQPAARELIEKLLGE